MSVTEMTPEPEFVEAPARRLIALSREFTFDGRNKIPVVWDDFWSREWKLTGDEEL